MTLIPSCVYTECESDNYCFCKKKGERKYKNTQRIISLVLKAVALGMAVVSIILGFLPEAADIGTQVTLLSIGLFTLSVAALQKEE